MALTENRTIRLVNIMLIMVLLHQRKTIKNLHEMNPVVRKQTRWFLTRSDTNLPVQSQKARTLKFWKYVEEKLFYMCS